MQNKKYAVPKTAMTLYILIQLYITFILLYNSLYLYITFKIPYYAN